MDTPVPTAAPPPRPRTSHGVLRAVGAGVTGLLVLAGATSALPQLVTSSQLRDLGWEKDTVELQVDGAVGDVRVREGGEPSIMLKQTWAFHEPKTTVDSVDGVTTVAVDCSNGFLRRCNGDWDIVVPSGTKVVVRSSFGDIGLRDVTGDVVVAGSVGDVDVTGAPASLDVQTSVGDVTAHLAEPVESVRVQTNIGDITLVVPDTVAYAVQARSELATPVPMVRQDPDSPYTIDVSSDIGEIKVSTE